MPRDSATGLYSTLENSNFPAAPGVTIASAAHNAVIEDQQDAINVTADQLQGIAWTDAASASTVDLGAIAASNVRITGTTTITGFGTVRSGITKTLRFAAALQITYNATSLILPGVANITTAANDTAKFVSLGSGNWICVSYQRARGVDTALNLLWWGADPTGATDSTTAVTNWMTACKTLGRDGYAPSGTYKCTAISLSDFNYVRIYGDGMFATIFSLTATGTLWTFPGAQFLSIDNIGFQSFGTPQSISNAYGVRFDTAAGNCQIEDCSFVGFSQDGLRLIGTSGDPLTGFKVRECFFLGNGGKQFYSEYSNDFHYEDNQLGRLAGVTKATHGTYLVNSSAGAYEGNYHWDNAIGLYADSCNYNTYSLNRVEESDGVNAYFTGGSYNIVTSNKFHTPNKVSSGTSDNVYFASTTNTIFDDNSLFTFSASYYSDHGVNIDTSNTNFTYGKNQIAADSYDNKPVRMAGSSTVNGSFEVVGSTSSTVAAGSTVYLVPGFSAATESPILVPRKSVAIRLYIAVTGVPGVGETFTYTVRIGGADTSLTATISGNATFAAVDYTAEIAAQDDRFSIKLVTSAAAAAVLHRYFVTFCER